MDKKQAMAAILNRKDAQQRTEHERREVERLRRLLNEAEQRYTIAMSDFTTAQAIEEFAQQHFQAEPWGKLERETSTSKNGMFVI